MPIYGKIVNTVRLRIKEVMNTVTPSGLLRMFTNRKESYSLKSAKIMIGFVIMFSSKIILGD